MLLEKLVGLIMNTIAYKNYKGVKKLVAGKP